MNSESESNERRAEFALIWTFAAAQLHSHEISSKKIIFHLNKLFLVSCFVLQTRRLEGLNPHEGSWVFLFVNLSNSRVQCLATTSLNGINVHCTLKSLLVLYFPLLFLLLFFPQDFHSNTLSTVVVALYFHYSVWGSTAVTITRAADDVDSHSWLSCPSNGNEVSRLSGSGSSGWAASQVLYNNFNNIIAWTRPTTSQTSSAQCC